jgi:hypothetical protein
MAIGSVIEVRRNLLRGALSLLGIAASGAAAARIAPRARRRREDLLLDEAVAWLELQFARHGELLVGPISTLQRRFGLDYGPAVELAGRLEDAQVWTVFRDGAGMRCARRVNKA